MLIVDIVYEFFGTIYRASRWILLTFWRFSRGMVRRAMPGQPRGVHTLVTAFVVAAEVWGIWFVLATHAARSHS
jgi:hypothetical protein